MTVSVTELPQSESGCSSLMENIAVLVIVIVAAEFLAIVWWNRRQRSFLKMFNGSNGTNELKEGRLRKIRRFSFVSESITGFCFPQLFAGPC